MKRMMRACALLLAMLLLGACLISCDVSDLTDVTPYLPWRQSDTEKLFEYPERIVDNLERAGYAVSVGEDREQLAQTGIDGLQRRIRAHKGDDFKDSFYAYFLKTEKQAEAYQQSLRQLAGDGEAESTVYRAGSVVYYYSGEGLAAAKGQLDPAPLYNSAAALTLSDETVLERNGYAVMAVGSSALGTRAPTGLRAMLRAAKVEKSESLTVYYFDTEANAKAYFNRYYAGDLYADQLKAQLGSGARCELAGSRIVIGTPAAAALLDK